ncbi:hypothetical protein HDU76_002631, partial [Blyttiomyces sp. JEL0837]
MFIARQPHQKPPLSLVADHNSVRQHASTSQWAAHLRHPIERRDMTIAEATEFAELHGFIFLGQVGDLKGFYLFESDVVPASAVVNLNDVDLSRSMVGMASSFNQKGTQGFDLSFPPTETLSERWELSKVFSWALDLWRSKVGGKGQATESLPEQAKETATPLRRLRRRTVQEVDRVFEETPNVQWVQRQVARRLYKRQAPQVANDDLMFSDPLFPKQWHLVNRREGEKGNDINVMPVWKRGINGSGVTVAILDDGVEFTHPDFLQENWSAESSYDFNERTNTPWPQEAEDKHGTRCAGEVAAAPNNVCGVGVAYGARLAGERLIADSTTDAVEAQALNYKFQINDIYSASWGPNDDGASVDGPGYLGINALLAGVTRGRGGRGSIFVFASGNGGLHGDNCNFDGYANSIYTVSVGAINYSGKFPSYGEQCSAHLGVTYSGGDGVGIQTTDVQGQCTDRHSGTSAAAPIASGIIALMLSARPELSWRDVQQLIVETSQITDPEDPDWVRNGAGRLVSHKYGFGRLDADKL